MSNIETIIVGYVQGEDVYEIEFVPKDSYSSLTWEMQNEITVFVYDRGVTVGYVRNVKYVYRSTQDDS